MALHTKEDRFWRYVWLLVSRGNTERVAYKYACKRFGPPNGAKNKRVDYGQAFIG